MGYRSMFHKSQSNVASASYTHLFLAVYSCDQQSSALLAVLGLDTKRLKGVYSSLRAEGKVYQIAV